MAGITTMAAPAGGETAGRSGAMVEVRNLSKSFGATRALDGVSLEFRQGEVHCLLGENGAGKSTLGKIIAGMYEPDGGELWVGGRRLTLRSVAEGRAAGIAVVFQELSLAPDLTVQENICLGTERPRHPFARLRRQVERERCADLLRALEAEIDPAARVSDLPVANQQMVEIAKAVLLRPRVLILDEPTAMLGTTEKGKLFRLLHRLKADGTTLVFITHHIDEVVEIGDRVSIMKDGALVDTFPLHEGIDADAILEKLAGKRTSRASAGRQAPAAEEVLALRNLAGRGEAPAEIRVRRGEIVGLYGVVGCGRERLARALVGLEELRPAVASLQGRPYRPRSPALAAKAGVAYLPSGRASNCILPTRSIRENLMLTQLRRFHRGGFVAGARERAAADEQLARLRTRLSSPDDLITSLSGGNQQKVLLGRCLGHATRLLILEDPTAGIDVAAKQEIHAMIRARADDGLAVIVLSSELGETLSLCDVIYTIFKHSVRGEYRSPDPADEPMILADILGGPADPSQARHAS